MTPKKMITGLLLLASLALLLSGCSVFSFLSGPNCSSGTYRQPGNLVTGQKGRDAVTGTLCTDKSEYNTGDTVHITLTVKNLLDEQIVLDGGQQPVMDMCAGGCFSSSQSAEANLTRLVLEPGQSHTIQWDWPTPDVDLQSALGQTNMVVVNATWVSVTGGGDIRPVQLRSTKSAAVRTSRTVCPHIGGIN